MATKKSTSTKSSSKATKSTNALYSIYGARMSKSGERVNISILTGRDEDVSWGTISLPIDGSKNVKVTVKELEVVLKVPRVDLNNEEDEEDED